MAAPTVPETLDGIHAALIDIAASVESLGRILLAVEEIHQTLLNIAVAVGAIGEDT